MSSTSRAHRRHRVHTACVVRSAEDDRLIADETLDMSWSGIRVPALSAARVGERLCVSVHIPGSFTWLDADGEVARVCAGRRRGEDRATLGVRLRRMDGMDRLLLGSVLSHYPEAPKSGGVRATTRESCSASQAARGAYDPDTKGITRARRRHLPAARGTSAGLGVCCSEGELERRTIELG